MVFKKFDFIKGVYQGRRGRAGVKSLNQIFHDYGRGWDERVFARAVYKRLRAGIDEDGRRMKRHKNKDLLNFTLRHKVRTPRLPPWEFNENFNSSYARRIS